MNFDLPSRTCIRSYVCTCDRSSHGDVTVSPILALWRLEQWQHLNSKQPLGQWVHLTLRHSRQILTCHRLFLWLIAWDRDVRSGGRATRGEEKMLAFYNSCNLYKTCQHFNLSTKNMLRWIKDEKIRESKRGTRSGSQHLATPSNHYFSLPSYPEAMPILTPRS